MTNSSKRKALTKGWLALILALLVLGVNFALQQFTDTELPEAITDQAETVVATSVQGLLDGETDVPAPPIPTLEPSPTRTPKSDLANPTRTPKPTATAQADSTDGIWEGVDADFDYYVLALSWEPAFCEDNPYKDECMTQDVERFDASNFVLHGLWPDDGDSDYNDTYYCDVSSDVVAQDKAYDWCEMPELNLPEPVMTNLFVYMPGTESCLENHEWYKHGTCSELSPEQYFALSNHLVALFAATDFNAYVAERVGEQVSRNELLDLFEAEFGAGADRYLALRCEDVGSRTLLSELYITLQQDIDSAADFSSLLPEGDWKANGSCPREFWIDEVGLNN